MGYWQTLITYSSFNIILALSVYIVLSTGQLSVAQAGFYCIGAYVSAMGTMLWGIPLIPAILLGGLLSSLTAIAMGIPVLRLKGIYLAIATLAFSEIVRVFFHNLKCGHFIKADITGKVADQWLGPDGAVGFSFITYNLDHGITPLEYFGLIILYVIILLVFFYLLEKSRMGYGFSAVRQGDAVASFLGLNITRIKIIAFSLGGFIAGVGGGLYSHYMTVIRPEQFDFSLSFLAIIFVAIGGTETFWGSVFGAVLLTFLPEWLRVLKDYRMIFYGLILIFMMVYRQQGLIDRDLLRVLRKYLGKRR
jgi:branched-chain amino acid transport system permease protein